MCVLLKWPDQLGALLILESCLFNQFLYISEFSLKELETVRSSCTHAIGETNLGLVDNARGNSPFWLTFKM